VGRLPPHCCDIIPKEDHEWLSTEYQRLWDMNHSTRCFFPMIPGKGREVHERTSNDNDINNN
jgi:hypothetical protein